jgi:hypothetical protein
LSVHADESRTISSVGSRIDARVEVAIRKRASPLPFP